MRQRLLPQAVVSDMGQIRLLERNDILYNFSKEQESAILNKAKNLIGQSMRYSELCRALGILPETAGKKKARQLRDFNNLFEYSVEPNGKQVKYVINKVYSEPLLPYYDKDEWYIAIKTRICEILRDNNYQVTWFTKTPLLRNLGAVNDNYAVIMNLTKRLQLEDVLGRDMSVDHEVCRIFGNLLSDRIYDALNRMAEKEKIIAYSDGYVVRYIKDDITQYHLVPMMRAEDSQLVKSELGEYLRNLEIKAIDYAIEQNNPDIIKYQHSFNRDFYKHLYYDDVESYLNQAFLTSDVQNYLYDNGIHFDKIKGIYSVKFITPIQRQVESELRWFGQSQKIINNAAKEKLLTSKSKELKRYEAMKKGLIDICIDLSTETKYEDMIKENSNAEN